MTSRPLCLLLAALTCVACSTPNVPQPVQLPPIIEIKTIFQYPEVPPEHLIQCPRETPVVNPDTSTSEERDAWGEQVRVAGGTCRGEADWWLNYARSWPKPMS